MFSHFVFIFYSDRRCLLFETFFVSLLFFSTHGVEIECEFSIENHLIGEVYSCKAKGLLDTSEDGFVETIFGDHLPGKSNLDVNMLQIDDQKLNFFPSNIENFLPNLEVLKIVSSGLKILSQGNFETFADLKLVDLSDNEIESLDEDLFTFNPALKHILLDSNKIKNIAANIFEPLHGLESVSLKNNDCIDDSWSKPEDIADLKTKLEEKCSEEIKLIETDKRGLWSSPSVKQRLGFGLTDTNAQGSDYEIDSTKVTKITKFTRVSSSSNFNLDTEDFDVEEISCDLSEAYWKYSASELFTCTIKNQPIDHSNFKVKISQADGEKVKGLIFDDDKKVKFLPMNLAEVFPNLEELSVKHSFIESISGKTLEGLKSLKRLSITNNDLSVIEKENFAHLTQLEELDLNEGNIRFIEEDAFSNLHSLKALYLGGNKLRFVQPKTFDGLANLQNISIELNHLTDLDDNVFTTNSKLINIWLNGNKINIMSPTVFEGLTNLAYVDLQENECIDGVFYPSTFEEMKNILLEKCGSSYVIRRTYKKHKVYTEGDEAEKHGKVRSEYNNNDGELVTIVQDVNVIENEDDVAVEATTAANEEKILVKNNPTEKTVVCDVENVLWSFSKETLSTCIIKDQVIDDKAFKFLPLSDNVEVTGLNMAFNKMVKYLPENTAQVFPNLEEFSAQNSSLVLLSRKNFAGLDSLKSLNLANNNIKFIETDTFDDLENLEELDLSSNNMEYIDENLFSKLKSLKTLRLGGNKLHFVHPKLFRSLRNLQNISISSNHLSTLDENLFRSNINLENVWLHGNKIKSLNSNIFKNAKELDYVDLRDNKCIDDVYEKSAFEVMTAEISKKCGDGYVLKSRSKIIKPTKKTQKKKKNKPETELKEVGCEYEDAFWPSLNKTLFTCVVSSDQVIDSRGYTISVNINPFALPLIDGDSVQALSFSSNKNIKFLPENIAEAFPNLLVLSSQDNSIETIAKSNLKNLNKLQSLSFSGNKIKSLEPNVLEDLTSLEEINLEDNDFEYVVETIFTYTKRLRKVKMSGNKLKTLNPEMFDDLTELIEVSIEIQDPSEVDEDFFKSNQNLKLIKINGKFLGPDLQPVDPLVDDELVTTGKPVAAEIVTETLEKNKAPKEVSCNFIETFSTFENSNVYTCELDPDEIISDDSYTLKPSPDLARVKRFSLDNNKNVKRLPENLSLVFPDLIEISTINSSLSRVSRNNFEGLKQLKFLNLSHNNILHIEPDAFDDLEMLESLDLSDNNMEFIEENLLYKLKSLKKLNLSGNKLHYLHPKTFKHLENLENLTLDGNLLSIIEPFMFRQNRKLQNIDLSNNKIESLSSKFVDHLKELKSINLKGNNCIDDVYEPTTFDKLKKDIKERCEIKSVTSNDVTCEFESFDNSCLVNDQSIEFSDYSMTVDPSVDRSKVQKLVFSGPRIKYLPKNISQTFPNLVELSAVNTTLTSISKENFLSLPKLETLKLGSVESIDPETFEDLTTLKTLHIDTDTDDIDDDTFSTLESLETFYFSTKTKKLKPKIFEHLTELSEFELKTQPMEYSEIVELQTTMVENIPKLKKFTLNEVVIKDENDDEEVEGTTGTLQPGTTDDSEIIYCDFEEISDATLAEKFYACNVKEATVEGSTFDDSYLNSKTQSLSFKNNKEVKFLPKNIAKTFPNLIEFNAKNSSLKKVDPETFKNLDKLKLLDLSSNEIESIDPETFTDLTSLEELDLSDNDIKDLSDNTFSSLTSLKSLKLKDNKLSSLNEEIFKDLHELTSINLVGNNLPQINEEELFQNNPKLTNVKLTIHHTIKPEAVTSSSISKTTPETDESSTTLKSKSEVTCFLGYAKWSNNNSPLITCDLKNQSINDPETFIKLTPYSPYIQGLKIEDDKQANYLPENIAESFPNLIQLSAKNSSLMTISKNDLNKLKKLRTLDLSENEIKTIEPEAFSDLVSLEELDLSNNQIEIINDNDVSSLTKLKSLDLNGNKIHYIHPEALAKLKQLVKINLEGNRLPESTKNEIYAIVNENLRLITTTEAPRREIHLEPEITSEDEQAPCFYFSWEFKGSDLLSCQLKESIDDPRVNLRPSSNNPRVQGLLFSENKEIKFLPQNLARSMPNLVIINGSYSSIESIDPNTFEDLSELKYLNLAGNKIKSIPHGAFNDLTSLEELDLSNNQIEYLDESTFNNLGSLTKLSLGGNNIRQLPPRIFESLPNLREFHIENNMIVNLSPGVFRNNRKLENVSLNSNKIRTLSPTIFDELRHLEHVDLQGNTCIDENYSGYNLASLSNDLRKNCYSQDVLVQPITFRPDTKPSISRKTQDTRAQVVPKDILCNFNYTEWPNNDKSLYTCTVNAGMILPHDTLKPSPYSNYVEALKLDNKSVRNLPKNIVATFPNLLRISAKNNSLTFIHPESLTGLSKLKSLDLSDNKLESVEPTTLTNLPSLEVLNLNHNRIKSLTFLPTGIKTLDVGDNQLPSVTSQFFENLPELKILNLERNNIEEIDENAFKNNKALEKISLGGNKITALNPKTFENLPHLKSINLEENLCVSGLYDPLSFKALTFEISRNCRLPSATNVNEIDGSDQQDFYIVPSNADYEDNSPARVDPNETIDIVNLSYRKLSCKFGETFSSFLKSYVYTCEVKRQPIHDPKYTFEEVPNNSRVKRLAFTGDEITEFLPDDIGQTFPNLVELTLKNSSLKTIRPENFKGMRQTKYLDLSGNNLIFIEPDVFDELTSLEELNLSQNNLKFIDELKLEWLKVLDLNGNKLSFIEPKTFSKLLELVSVDLTNNQLTSVDQEMFQSNPKLENIYLSFNKLKSIHPETFESLRRLKTVDLKENSCLNQMFSLASLENIKKTLHRNCQPYEILKNSFLHCKRGKENCERGLLSSPGSGNNNKDIDKIRAFMKKAEIKIRQMNNQQRRLRSALNYEKNLVRNFKIRVKNVDLENEQLRKKLETCSSADETQNILIDINCNFEESFEGESNDYTCKAENLQVVTENSTIGSIKGNHQRGKRDTDVTSLAVTDQTMKFLPHELSKFFPRLIKLSIENSKLSKINKFAFTGLPDLKELIITGNSIAEIEPGSFDHVHQLKLLDISRNHIHQLPLRAFENLHNLRTLNLNNNAIKSLNSDVMPDQSKIKIFTIKGNKLETVDPRIFKQLTNAETIDFTGNKCVDDQFSKDAGEDRNTMMSLIGEIAMRCLGEKEDFCNQ